MFLYSKMLFKKKNRKKKIELEILKYEKKFTGWEVKKKGQL